MKRILNMIAASCMVISLAGCGSDSAKDNSKQETESTVSIVTTIFPLYEWCREVLGENPGNARLSFLLDSGTDLHSYQPSAGDMVTVSECDLFVYIGGGSDVWVPDALGNSENPEQVSLNMMEVLKDSVREEEIIEGMEAEEEEEAEYDEHVWLSLKNAKTAVQAIASVMKEKDPVNADVYSANADGYCMYLDELTGSIPMRLITRNLTRWCSLTVSRSAILWMITESITTPRLRDVLQRLRQVLRQSGFWLKRSMNSVFPVS